MKTYEVEMCRTSFIIVTVEAENKDDAEEKAWAECERLDAQGDASWAVASIEEKKGE